MGPIWSEFTTYTEVKFADLLCSYAMSYRLQILHVTCTGHPAEMSLVALG